MSEEKDCECLTHDGPHWRHMDAIWKEQNRELLQQLHRYEQDRNYSMWAATLHCYAQNEQQRLAEKLPHLKRLEAAV